MDAVEYIVWRLCILLRRVTAALTRVLDWLLQVACFTVQLSCLANLSTAKLRARASRAGVPAMVQVDGFRRSLVPAC